MSLLDRISKSVPLVILLLIDAKIAIMLYLNQIHTVTDKLLLLLIITIQILFADNKLKEVSDEGKDNRTKE